MTDLTVVVPVKSWRHSKSRLDVPARARERLARSFAMDVLEAVSGSAHIEQLVIVTAEPELINDSAHRTAVVLPDRPDRSPGGLTGALESGARWSARRRPHAPILIVPADLPALTSSALDAAIEMMRGQGSAFVPDAEGRGTTVYWSAAPRFLELAYGPGSAAGHVDRGARAVPGAPPGVRRDVDKVVDLEAAIALGVGPNTLAALEVISGDTSRAVVRS